MQTRCDRGTWVVEAARDRRRAARSGGRFGAVAGARRRVGGFEIGTARPRHHAQRLGQSTALGDHARRAAGVAP